MKKENEFIEIEFNNIEELEFNKRFTENLYKKIDMERENILDILKIEEARKIKIKLYDNKELFFNDIKGFYKDNKVPDYCKGTIQKGEVYFLVNTELKEDSYKYELELRKIIHEYIHILYNEIVLNSDNRITWIDEGIAQNLSKEKGRFAKEKFPILSSNIEEIDLNKLEHENGTFVTANINGYDVSYLTVKYLLETMSNEDFNSLIRNKDEIIKIRKNNLAKG